MGLLLLQFPKRGFFLVWETQAKHFILFYEQYRG